MDWRRALRRAIENPGMAYDTAVGLLRGRYYRVKFRLLGRRVTIGKFFRVSGQLDIRGPGTVIIGDYCSIASPHLRPTTPYTHSPEAVIRIGHHVMLTGTRFGCAQLIEIGDNVSLSDSRLMDTDFHSIEASSVPRYNTTGRSKPILIGANAWIGAGSMILKGVTVGEHAVVAAGAVVVSRVPPRSVVLGNPARVIWRVRSESARPAVVAPADVPAITPVAAPRTASLPADGAGTEASLI
jgi:acetyltransferase-like isoleucine patch superfamily enzyme